MASMSSLHTLLQVELKDNGARHSDQARDSFGVVAGTGRGLVSRHFSSA